MDQKKERLENEVYLYPLQVNLIILERNGKPALEIRKTIGEADYIKAIISAALSGKMILMMPTFRDRIRAVGTLCEKNVLEYNSDKKEYYYLI